MRDMWAKTACLLLALVLATALVHARGVDRQSSALSPSSGDSAASFLELSTSSRWVHGVRHRRRFGSVRAERERAAQKAREDAIYEENLRRLAMRTSKWRVGGDAPAAAPRVLAETAARLGGALMSAEEAQVESLLQLSAKPTMELHHVNNVRAKLTPDLLHGRGLHNAVNRRATAAGLAASPRNRPPAPAFTQLPPLNANSAPRAQAQPAGVSLLATGEQTRPSYLGPATAAPPPAHASAPTVLQSAPAPGSALAPAAAPAPAASAADSVLEHQFVSGLPPAFMELDSATQLHILQLVDAGVDVEAKAEAKANAHAENKGEAKAEAKTEAKKEANAEAKAAAQPQAEAARPAALAGESAHAAVGEDELASAATALNTLALLQKESHVPINKLIRLLAANGKRA